MFPPSSAIAARDGRARRWDVGSKIFTLSPHALLMGVVNVTPDSFSDGGIFPTPVEACAHASALEVAGADLLDIGGESTRPGAPRVSEEEELRRVLPVLASLAGSARVPLSIDTRKPSVARAALAGGASVLNDVSGFTQPAMVDLAASSRCGIVIMHMQGDPSTMQSAPTYTDVVGEVIDFLENRAATCMRAGIAPDRIAIDPGIGFGKTLDHNLALLSNLDRLAGLGFPVLLGVSRKSFIGRILGTESMAERAWPTVALSAYAREKGVSILRVHDVRSNWEGLRMTEAILQG